MTQEAPPHLGFARKYRPQSFDEVVGQEAVSVTLKNAITEKTPAHAYLFFGPRGIGKTTTARILAKALNCGKGPTPEPCGKCDACVEIAAGSCIDVLELDAATHTQVDRIREMIIETVSLAPSRDRFKVFIIDEVHMLSTASFNALLKTLEEPPAHVVFILATTDPQKIPPTIVSRCQRFRFRPIPLDVLARHLQRLAKREEIRAEAAAVDLLSRSAAGSLRDAVSLLEQAHAYAEGELTEEKVRELLGSLPEKIVLDLARSILAKDAGGVSRALESVWEEGAEAGQLLRDLRDRLHAAYLYRLGAAEGPAADWRALADPVSPETFGYLVGRLNKILEGLRNSDSPRLNLELGIYGLLEAAYDLRGWIARLEALERRVAAGDSEAPDLAPAADSAPEARPERSGSALDPTAPAGADPPPRAAREGSAASPGAVAAPQGAQPAAPRSAAGRPGVWPAVLERLRHEKPGLAHDLRAARLVPSDGPEWGLVFQRAFDLERARQNQRMIEAELSTVCGRSVQLRLETGGAPAPPPGPAPEAAPDPSQAPAPESAQEEAPPEDAGVRKVLEVFPGKVRHLKKK